MSKAISRRDFLKVSGAVGAAGPFLRELRLPRRLRHHGSFFVVPARPEIWLVLSQHLSAGRFCLSGGLSARAHPTAVIIQNRGGRKDVP